MTVTHTHRRKMNRHPTYDYNSSGAYFVTISVHQGLPKRDLFGVVDDGIMNYSQIGSIAEAIWKQIPDNYQGVKLDEYCLMPDHVHGIIWLCNEQNVPLSKIIKAYKSITTKEIHKVGYHCFQWQKNYYDRIIRKEKSLHNIRNYIATNPVRLGQKGELMDWKTIIEEDSLDGN